MRSLKMAFPMLFLTATACSQPEPVANTTEKDQPIAFPGAEGFGKFTTGGRAGKVFIVTNLNDTGEGSFRKAATAKESRMIVFAVSGTIHLQSPISIQGNVTIAGQSAPGDGICIADHPVSLGGNNIVIRFLRFRMGDKYQNKGMVHGSGHDDALGGFGKSNIIIDHCSISWSTDECFSVYGGDSTTLQWNIISEPLNYSYHFEEGDKDFEKHGYGGIWGGKRLSAHHNLFAHCNSRTPRFNGTRSSKEDFVDFRNNLIYNWGGNNVYGGEGGNYNLVNNFYKYGPSTNKNVRARIVNPNKDETRGIGFGKYYVSGNFVDGSREVTTNNLEGVHLGNGGTAEDKKQTVLADPHPAEMIHPQSAEQAYDLIIKNGGAYLPARDTLDQRIIEDLINRKGRFIDVQGGHPHGTPYELTVTAWPALKSSPAPLDADKDGIPDDWEKKNKLNPADASDALIFSLNKKYTNIEMYLNSLAEKKR